mmetsp:Transcript_34184/g.69068  ORF Transcript_34184/g.69068 Transcript_34184/m.69068 type:complete len:116 (+) Transcript_34184:89-436(+)
MAIQDAPCLVCGKPGQAHCSRCHAVTYCGPECQRSDWKRHKASCGTGSKAAAGAPAPASASRPAAEPAPSKPRTAPSKPLPGAESAKPSFAPAAAAPAAPLSGHPGDPAVFDVVL